MISFFTRKAKQQEKLQQEQYRIAYEHEQAKLKQKYEPLFLTLLLLCWWGNKTIKQEQIGESMWYAPTRFRISLSRSGKPLFEVRVASHDPFKYTLTTFTPNKQEYQDFPTEYARQLFNFLASFQGKKAMVQMLHKNGNRVPKTNEYLENLLSYTMLQNGIKPTQAFDIPKQGLLHNLINTKRYSK